MKPLVLGLCALAPLAWSALKRVRVDVGPLLRPALSRFRLGGAGPTDEEDVDDNLTLVDAWPAAAVTDLDAAAPASESAAASFSSAPESSNSAESSPESSGSADATSSSGSKSAEASLGSGCPPPSSPADGSGSVPEAPRPHPPWKAALGAGSAFALCAAAAVVASKFGERIPYSWRWHIVIVSPAFERRLGSLVFKSKAEELFSAGRLLSSPASDHHRQRIDRILKPLIKVATGTPSTVVGEKLSPRSSHNHLRDLEWEYGVVADENTNATVYPGGELLINTGLLKLCINDDELAVVLGHEVAHVLARHGIEKLGPILAARILGGLLLQWPWLSIAFRNSNPIPICQHAAPIAILLDLARLAGQLLVTLPRSRFREFEADHLGLHIQVRTLALDHVPLKFMGFCNGSKSILISIINGLDN